MTKCPPKKSFTIGWICALSIELSAARRMLDEEFTGVIPFKTSDSDINTYTFGRIGTHNIVIACLPYGCTGTDQAAIVAVYMRSSFPKLRFNVLVGIGGGVPSKVNDIRLGDVVVSTPSGTHGGVIQYDFGKTGPDGRITRTGSLNTPPKPLLSALSKFASNRYEDNSKLSAHMPKDGKFAPPEHSPDVLFTPSSPHIGGRTCSGCDQSDVIQRPPRSSTDPCVFFGNIASGNQVMKDGITRDRHSRDLEGILCFEMEAAGLMKDFGCIVIRGICDYADAHKNDVWQPYAAVTAAACAKELLCTMPTVISEQPEDIPQEAPNPVKSKEKAPEVDSEELRKLVSDDSKLRAVLYLAAFNPFEEPLNAMIYLWLFKTGYFENPTMESLIGPDSDEADEYSIEEIEYRRVDVESKLESLTGGILRVIDASQYHGHKYFSYRVNFVNAGHLKQLKRESQCSDPADRPFKSGLRNLDIYCGLRSIEAKFVPTDSPSWEVGELFRKTFDWLTPLALKGYEPEVPCLVGFERAASGPWDAFRRRLTVCSDKSFREEREYDNCSFVHWAAYRGQGSYVRQVVQKTADGGKSLDSGGLNLLLSASLSTNSQLTGYLLSKDVGRQPNEAVTLVNVNSYTGRPSASVWMVVLRDLMNNINYYWQAEKGRSRQSPLGKEWLAGWSKTIEAYLKAGADQDVVFKVKAGHQTYRAQLRDIFDAFGLDDLLRLEMLRPKIPSLLQSIRDAVFPAYPPITKDILQEEVWVIEGVTSPDSGNLMGPYRVRVC